jgi:hypothetical protein
MTTALEGVEGSVSRPGRSLPPGKDPIPIVQEAAWAPGPVWTGSENLSPNGIRSPDLPVRSQSLYRLHYQAHFRIMKVVEILYHGDHSHTRVTVILVSIRDVQRNTPDTVQRNTPDTVSSHCEDVL